MNTDNINKIFKMLGVKPNERFKIKIDNNTSPLLYKIDESLTVFSFCEEHDKTWKWKPNYSANILRALLNGSHTIVKFNKMTKKEKIAIEYAKACGCKWMAEDGNGKVFAYRKKPIKGSTTWHLALGEDVLFPIGIPISFISFDDDEPYCLRNNLS